MIETGWFQPLLVAVGLLVSLIIPFVVFDGGFPANLVNKNDAPLWAIQLVNIAYKIRRVFRGTENKVCAIDLIIVYPIKSIGKGLSVKEWEIGEFGLLHDRHYVFASYNKETSKWDPITLRQTLELIDVEYDIDGEDFVVKYGDGKKFKLPMEMSHDLLVKTCQCQENVQLWRVPAPSYDVSHLFPRDFIRFFKLPEDTKLFYTEEGHLVRTGSPDNLPNTVKGAKYRHATFQDYFPLLILSNNDLDHLNKKLEENNYGYFKVNKFSFRPNIVVNGQLAPHDEDNWYRFKIYTQKDHQYHYFTTTTKCGRCQVPNINYSNGQKMDTKSPVSKTLSKYRRIDVGNKFLAYFGIYAVQHETHYKLSVGDTFDIMERRVNIYEHPR